MKEEKKYEITEEVTEIGAHILHRIKALKDFANFPLIIKKGDLGGWIESEANLSQEGNCWVDMEAKVYEDARVYGDAHVYGICGIYGNARVYGKSQVYGSSCVCGNAKIFGNARISNDSCVSDNAQIYENAQLWGGTWVYGDVKIHGNSCIFYATQLYGDADIQKTDDYITFIKTWSDGASFTWVKNNDTWYDDFFHGTAKEFIQHGYDESKENGKHFEKYVKFVEQFK